MQHGPTTQFDDVLERLASPDARIRADAAASADRLLRARGLTLERLAELVIGGLQRDTEPVPEPLLPPRFLPGRQWTPVDYAGRQGLMNTFTTSVFTWVVPALPANDGGRGWLAFIDGRVMCHDDGQPIHFTCAEGAIRSIEQAMELMNLVIDAPPL